jgi:hypothetical protein
MRRPCFGTSGIADGAPAQRHSTEDLQSQEWRRRNAAAGNVDACFADVDRQDVDRRFEPARKAAARLRG